MLLSKPNMLLRIEGLAISILGVIFYWNQEYSWILFWSTILLPDVALLAYFVNKETGAAAYNLTHAKILPSLLACTGVVFSMPVLLALSIIWFVHIGVDRGLGYGLKYSRGFKFTHLGIIGKKRNIGQLPLSEIIH